MPELTPLDDNRQEHFLNGEDLEPITRREHFYAGRESELPAGHQEPETREEWFIQKYRGGGGDITVVPLSVTENGTYSEEGKAYSPVSVNVPLPQNAYLLKSVPNLPQAIATFKDGADAPMPSLKVAIEPQQDLHGYDSPWVGGAGKNKFDQTTWQYYNVSRKTNATNIPSLVTLLNSLPVGNYTFSAKFKVDTVEATQTYRNYGFFVTTTGSYSVENYTRVDSPTVGAIYEASITINKSSTDMVFNAVYIYAGRGSVSDTATIYNMQLESGNTKTTFAPYSNICPISGWDKCNVTVADDIENPTISNVYPIDLDGTRYGGELDVVSGEGTDRLRYVDMGDITWSYDGNGIFFVNNLSGLKLNGDAISSAYATTKSYLTVMSTDGTLWVSDARNQLVVHNNAYISASDFKTAMNGVQLVYELATPLTIQLTPTAVKSLLGSNNVWTDTGDITDAEYFSKEV